MRRPPTHVVLVTLCLALLSACDGGSGRAGKAASDSEEAAPLTDLAGVPAVLTHNIDLSVCLAEENPDAAAPVSTCPTYVLQTLSYMVSECNAAGGALQTMPEAGIWTLEVDGDDKPEVLIDLTQNFTCYGAPSVFSCGSLGCPYFLYAQRGDAWIELGAVNADDAPGVEALPAKPGTPATLRGGCIGERPCSELTFYIWKDKAYERARIEYRGHIVDVVPNDLWMLTKDAAVLTAPSSNGQPIDEYPAGTAVVVIGTAREGPYKYVSPCNACRRGFMDASLLMK